MTGRTIGGYPGSAPKEIPKRPEGPGANVNPPAPRRVSLDVLGLDLSLTATGTANAAGPALFRSKLRGIARLSEIAGWVLLQARDVTWVAIEGYSFGTGRQSSQAHALGELGGVVRYQLWQNSIEWAEVPPASLKRYATGRGNAGKPDMLVAAIRRLGYEGASFDEVDALFLRAMALDAIGARVVKMPESHRSALAAVSWPGLASVMKEEVRT